ncbi:thiamine pyrophosphate-dependent dehydrogenase E1 component subunit alpha [Brevibacterium daeguense]|nr:thiamine pyrophosphate-dependent dehydrogenase E1 component subunit alpha [Brevibacterium daeguense]
MTESTHASESTTECTTTSTTTRSAPADAPVPDTRETSAPGRDLSDDTRLGLYSTMVLSRTYEEAILREYHADKGPGFDIGKGLIPGEMHLSAGQEPVAAGVCAHLTAEDAVTATHRPHHFAVAHGVDMKKMTAEIFGRTTGLGRGRGGHMHLFDPDVHFSCSGIVAEGYPPALGMAFAFKRRGTDAIAVAVAGEGAANQGAFHESLNLAALWKLPVVFIVEDNEWGISVARTASTAVSSNAVRAAGYGIPGERIEDNDVEAVYQAAGRAVERARAGEGPSLIEVATLRLWGHFEGDAQGYRTDLDDITALDPIPRYESRLREAGVLDDAAVDSARERAVTQVEEAIDFAKDSDIPDPADLMKYIFAEEER